MSYCLKAIVLAAGLSTRMGQFKLLMRWVDGQPIIAHVVSKLISLPLDSTVIVTGHRAREIEQALKSFEVRFVHNPHYATGEILSSLQAGIKHLPSNVDGVLVLPADLPRIPTHVIKQVMQAYVSDAIVVPRYKSRRGHPVIFAHCYWESLLALPFDSMPREIMTKHQNAVRWVDVDTDAIFADVDTPTTYEREFQRALLEQSEDSDS